MIVGHARQLRYFERVVKNGRVAHAYLFSGPDAVGKRTVALAFAKTLLCSENAEKAFGGCGWCEDCRLAEASTHPDLLALRPGDLAEAGDTGREIGIAQVHELTRLLAQTAWRAGWRAVIIDGAHALSRDAQAALLKTMEEPKANVVFFFITSRPGALVPTIHSRSVPVSFTTILDADLEPLLAPLPRTRHAFLLALAEGRAGLLCRLMNDPKAFSAHEAEVARFMKLLESDLSEQFSFSETESREPGRLEAWYAFLVRHLAAELRRALDDVSETGQGPERLAGFLSSLLRNYSLLETAAVNRRLWCDSIFFELQALARSVPL